MAEAGGAFVTRSFERMLKEASGRKYINLQNALKAYLGTRTQILFILCSTKSWNQVIFYVFMSQEFENPYIPPPIGRLQIGGPLLHRFHQ